MTLQLSSSPISSSPISSASCAASVARFCQVTICQFHLHHMCHPQEDGKAISATIVPKANDCRDQLDWSFGAGIVKVTSKHAPFMSHTYSSLPQPRSEKSSCFTPSHPIAVYHLKIPIPYSFQTCWGGLNLEVIPLYLNPRRSRIRFSTRKQPVLKHNKEKMCCCGAITRKDGRKEHKKNIETM